MISNIARKWVVATMLIAMMGVGTAQASDHLSECADEEALQQALTQLNFKNEKDFVGLNTKLTAAFDKVELEAKYCDGIQKLQDFQNKLRKLVYASKPKATEDPAYPGTLACLFAGTQQLIEEWQAVTSQTGGCEDRGDPPRGKGPRS